jgi:CubicO group peptidase (beta-lactamase class C family)
MFKGIKLIGQILLFQLTARSQNVPFEQLPFTNELKTDTDSILHEQVKKFFKKAKSPGLIIGISQNGENKFYSYGFADSVSKQSFNAQTIFEIGSITKTFTANLLFQLNEQRILDIQDPILNYLPAGFAMILFYKKLLPPISPAKPAAFPGCLPT